MDASLLASIWFALTLVLLAMALAMEGFSLGVGVLSLFARTREQREALMGSISPLWHANLTWLVLFGAVLFGAFPLLYGIVLSTLYLPAILMLLGFIGRGIGLELYAEVENKTLMHLLFGLGSLLAALALGLGLGGALSGLGGLAGSMAGGDLRWISPMAMVEALAVICVALLLAALFLVQKTDDLLQEASRSWARALFPLTLVLGLAADLWLISRFPSVTHSWLAWPGALYSLLPLVLALICFLLAWQALRRGAEHAPFRLAMAFLILLVLGFGGSLYPRMLPDGLTVAQAAGQDITLRAMLWVFAIFLPLIVVYNFYVYKVFKGKVNREGYGIYEH